MERGLWSVQYLRAVAALSLVVFHALLRTEYPNDAFRVGTDIFFVTSGFLIWTVMARKQVSAIEFAARRITRLAPLYWLLTIVTFIAATVRPGLYWMVDTSPLHLIKSLLFIPDYDRHGALYPVLLQAWMLNALVYLYLLFSLTLVLRPPLRFWAFSLGLVAIHAAGACLTVRSAPIEAYTNPVLLEFLGGVWLAELNLRAPQREPRVGAIAICAGALWLVAAQFLPHEDAAWRLIRYGPPALLFLAGIVVLEQAGTLRPLPLAKLLGDASYAIYVSHLLVVEVLARLLPEMDVPARVMLTVLAASLIGIVLYRSVEAPIDVKMRAITDRMFGTRRIETLAPSA